MALSSEPGHLAQVDDRRKDLPKDLLDMVLLGIREPKKLSLHTIKERLMAAIDASPNNADGRERASECSSSIKLRHGGDPCTPAASPSRAQGDPSVGDAAKDSAVAVHAPAAAADAAPETAHGGRWFADLTERSEAAQEAAAGTPGSLKAETGLEAAVEVGCSAGQRSPIEAVLEASEARLGKLPATAAGADATGFARWDAGTEAALEAPPRLLGDVEWAAGQHAVSVAAPHVAAGAARGLGGQASCSATQHGSAVALQALQVAAAWNPPAQADLLPAPSTRADAAWGPSPASEIESAPHALASIWGSGELACFNAAE